MDWTARQIEAAGRMPGTWDILDAGGAPATLCGNYETVEAAYAAIRTACFVPIREWVPAPPAFEPEHDRMSNLRFGRDGAAVIMVRRRAAGA